MENSSSSSESSPSPSDSSPGESTASSYTEKNIDRAELMLYFANNYGKLYKQINIVRNQHANHEVVVNSRLEELEKNISQNTEEIKCILYHVTELSKSIESIQKNISQLKIYVDHQEQAEILSKNTSERSSP